MKEDKINGRRERPAVYQIQVQTILDSDWAAWFDDMDLVVAGGITTLTGHVQDQPALHSLLARIRDAGLPLLSVTRVEDSNEYLN